ncbi:MAG: hypothetical protein AAF387_01260 [Pseudomonadota bacterium]
MKSHGPYFLLTKPGTVTEEDITRPVYMKCKGDNPVISFLYADLGKKWLAEMNMERECYIGSKQALPEGALDEIKGATILLFESDDQVRSYLSEREGYSESVALYSYGEACGEQART